MQSFRPTHQIAASTRPGDRRSEERRPGKHFQPDQAVAVQAIADQASITTRSRARTSALPQAVRTDAKLANSVDGSGNGVKFNITGRTSSLGDQYHWAIQGSKQWTLSKTAFDGHRTPLKRTINVKCDIYIKM